MSIESYRAEIIDTSAEADAAREPADTGGALTSEGMTETPEIDLTPGEDNSMHPINLLLKSAAEYPLLTGRQEIALARRIEKGDIEAKDRMVMSNVRLVCVIASRFQGNGLELTDLIQEGMVGLIRAVEKFDWRRGNRFSSYAVRWIKQAISRAITYKGRTIKIAIHEDDRIRAVKRQTDRLVVELGRKPSDKEIAAAAKISVEKLIEIKRFPDADKISLNKPIGEEGGSELGEIIPNDGFMDPLEETVKSDRSEKLEAALSVLPERRRRLIERRFELIETDKDDPKWTIRALAKRMSIAPDKVSRMQEEILEQLAVVGTQNGLRDSILDIKD
jgi:RNA polymerase primary sigma factor